MVGFFFRARIGVSPMRVTDKDQAAETAAANVQLQSAMSPFMTAETLGEVHDEDESQDNQVLEDCIHKFYCLTLKHSNEEKQEVTVIKQIRMQTKY